MPTFTQIRSINNLLFFLNIYILLLTLFYVFKIDALKDISNAFAGILIILAAATVAIKSPQLCISYHALVSLLAILFIFANAIIATKTENIPDLLKVAGIFLFFLCGQISTKISLTPLKTSRGSAYFFVAAPLSVYFIGLALSGTFYSSDSTGGTQIFANRNNAVLFSVISTYVLLLRGIKEKYVVTYIIFVAIFFQTLGALFSAIAAIYISYFSKTIAIKSVLLAPVFIAIFFLTEDLVPALSRISTVTDAMRAIFESGISLDAIRDTTYAEASLLAGTSDISFFFRLKHWLELLDAMREAPLINLIFGFGVNSSVELTTLSLVPHNDYLRMFFEMGIFPFLAFLTINYKIATSIKPRKLLIPALFLFFYFFSENLINNFLAMTFFYFVAGVLSAQHRAAPTQSRAIALESHNG